MSTPEKNLVQSDKYDYRIQGDDPDIHRHVNAYGPTGRDRHGKLTSGLVDALRIGGWIYSLGGEKLGVDSAPFNNDPFSSKDVPRIVGQLAAKNKFGN